MSQRHIRLSDNAKVSGLSVASTDGRTLVLGVLPKMWADADASGRAPARYRHVRWPDDAPQLRLTGHEGDVITIEGDARALRCVDELVKQSGRRASEGEDTALASSISEPGSLERGDVPSFSGIPALLELASRVGEKVEVRQVSRLPMSVDDPLLGDLLRWLFLRAAERAIRDLRRRYWEREDWIPAVRGRILPEGWTLARANGFTRTLCRFEEFEIGSSVLDVVAAALTNVALSARASTESLATIHLANRRQAAHLRRRLDTIDEPHPIVVRRLVDQPLRVAGGPVWEEALELARLVLRKSDGRGDDEPAVSTDVAGFELRIQTWHIWEQVLVERSRELATGGSASRVTTLSPFRIPGTEDPKPDLTVLDRYSDKRRLWVLDAKYKRVSRAHTAVDRNDRFQVFAYSHLTSMDDLRPHGVGILYPVPTGVAPWSAIAGRRNPDDGLPLLTAGLPFPQPTDCTAAGWEHYLHQTLTPALQTHVLEPLRFEVDAPTEEQSTPAARQS